MSSQSPQRTARCATATDCEKPDNILKAGSVAHCPVIVKRKVKAIKFRASATHPVQRAAHVSERLRSCSAIGLIQRRVQAHPAAQMKGVIIAAATIIFL